MSKTVFEKDYRKFLKKLIEARNDAGLSQREVATKLNKYKTYVQKCESGERRVDIFELRDYAELYSKSISYFIDSD